MKRGLLRACHAPVVGHTPGHLDVVRDKQFDRPDVCSVEKRVDAARGLPGVPRRMQNDTDRRSLGRHVATAALGLYTVPPST